MAALRLTIIAMAGVVLIFTALAIGSDGIDFLTPFVAPIPEAAWPGQFHVDFACYLALSGLWIAWRGGFSGGSIALGVLALMGMLFLAPYLLIQISRSGGNPGKLLLGVHHDG